jgi:hypothetical protein
MQVTTKPRNSVLSPGLVRQKEKLYFRAYPREKKLNALQNFVQSNSLNYTIITNSEDIASQYGLSGIPCTFFINKEGVIMHKEVGFRGEASIQSYVQELLN